jgi:hypothetical protein
MDRREFFLKTALLSAVLGRSGEAEANAQESGIPFKPVPSQGGLELTNPFLTWHLEWHDRRLTSSGFDNKLSGHNFRFSSARELRLAFSAAAPRLEIPWWKFVLGPDDGPVSPDQEHGLQLGYHLPDFEDRSWGVAENLLLRGLAGIERRPSGIRFDGYGWFRRNFELPSQAQGQEIVLVLGGYDHQDWNEYWVYVNGREIGHRLSRGRWRTPGEFRLGAASSAYAALRFGPGAPNLLAVRTRGFDKRFGGLSDEVLKHYVFEPVWVDQFISVGAPYLQVSDFMVEELREAGPAQADFELSSLSAGVRVRLHYELEGPTRRKWVEVENRSDKELRLLDVQLDDFATGSATSEGGPGEPVFLAEEAFAALEHPAGLNQGDRGRICLTHFPARLLPPGGKTRTHTALVSVAPPGQALDRFTAYLEEKSPRRKRAISLYTPYGINNQWGGCPPLDDQETLGILDVLERWQQKGVRFEYFTLDQGWMDNAGDLTQFAPQCYPQGPAKIAQRVRALGMKFGLWFSVSGANWSCGENPAVRPSFIPGPGGSEEAPPSPVLYRNGYVANGGVPGQLCVASEPYFSILRDAILYHMRENGLKFFKLDIGSYYCNSTRHGHLPGKYSVEAMYERLLEIAARARAADPDVYVMWYWGVRSPFFALHGDSIFESGLFMEGSGTSWYPALYYRDSVTLNLDQSTQFARTIPPLNKDSLGVWLSDIRWGNFMGNERWREALVMDLGRGNLLFPQFWSDINLLDDEDVAFLREIETLVSQNESVFLRRRNILGDPWKNEVYGYANVQGPRGFLFASNVHFAARPAALRLGAEIGLEAASGAPLEVVSHFPQKQRLLRQDGTGFRAGDTVELWLRPFEVLMLEVGPGHSASPPLPPRQVFASQAASFGIPLALEPQDELPWMGIGFAESRRFEGMGFKRKSQAWSAALPDLASGPHVLAIVARLRESGLEWRYSPGVVEIVQVVARIGEQSVPLIPVPDARQYGNTQKMGCSWVVYKLRLNREWSGKRLQFALQACLPESVEAQVEAWVVRRWWEENRREEHRRPLGDGYYGDAPS